MQPDPVLPGDTQSGVLAALKAGSLAAGKMILFTNQIAPNKDTLLEDLVQPAFTGYAPSAAVVWSQPYLDQSGRWVIASGGHTFIATDVAAEEVIYGYGITDTTGATLELSGLLENAVPIVAPDDGVTVSVVLPYGA